MGNETALFDLTGKSVIVTGSGRGLGRAMARGLCRAGANVVVCGRTPDLVNGVAKELEGEGYTVAGITFDATRRADVQRLMEQSVERFGSLDAIFINHGISRPNLAHAIAQDDWDEIIAVNLTGALVCAQLAGKQMIKQGRGGSIIFTGSTGSLVVFEGLASYGATKAGVDHLARQLAVEWGRHNIRVNVIAPGYMTSHMRGAEDRYEGEAHVKEVIARTPLGRKGEPEEMVGPAVFLASDASSFVTGHVLPVDGGWCLQ